VTLRITAVARGRTTAALGPETTKGAVCRSAAGPVGRFLSRQTLSTLAAGAAVCLAASTVTIRRAAVTKCTALALEAAIIRTTSSISGNGGAVTVTSARIEVDRPRHSASEAQIVGKIALHLMCLLVVVADPLVVPDELLHHRVGVEARRKVLFLDKLLDLKQ